MKRTSAFSLLLFILTLSLFSGCGSQPANNGADNSKHQSLNAEDLQALLQQAKSSESPLREELQLQAAELLFDAGQMELAQQLSDEVRAQLATSIDNNLLNNRLAMLDARLLIAAGDYPAALAALEQPALLDNLETLPLAQQLSISDLRATIYALQGNYLASAQQRIYTAPLLAELQQQENRDKIWDSLMYVPIADLKHYFPHAVSQDYRGWLELALIAKDNQGDLDQQLRQLDNWQLRWSEHPAANQLPGGLELLRELAADRPTKVALLLPLSGKLADYGRAVRDGFVAAYYQTRQQQGQVPQLMVIDSNSDPDFIKLYHQAVDDGAELIIGPLDKQRLRLLFDEGDLPAPTLALNRIDDYGHPPEQLVQFSLSPLDEARQVADIAFLDNHRRAMLIIPEGEWGANVSAAFNDEWQKLGGEVLAASIFSGQKDYSSTIKNALLLQTSEQRARRIQQVGGEQIEFAPRRREDIDMVFLLARPQQARSIKPLLAYHYAADLPVYATSRVYGGHNQPGLNKDINGLRFTDMPWVLEKPGELRLRIDKELPGNRHLPHMVALGIDSFQLYPRIRQLQLIPNSRVYGQTGTLKLNEQQQIERTLLFAEIKQGRAKLIPIAQQTLISDTKDGLGNVGTTQNYK